MVSAGGIGPFSPRKRSPRNASRPRGNSWMSGLAPDRATHHCASAEPLWHTRHFPHLSDQGGPPESLREGADLSASAARQGGSVPVAPVRVLVGLRFALAGLLA
jgi:hypothetical protein